MHITSRSTRLLNLSLLSLAAVTWLGACAKKDAATSDSARMADSAASSTMAAPAADSAKPASAPLNDAQIAHIAVTANAIDSAAGVTAKQKGTAKSVKDFAQTMINDHSAVNKQAVALATKLKVTPEDNDVSKSLKSDADASASNLRGKTGADFDKGYIDHEVTYHQTVLDALDKTLIPGAQNAELKALLEKVRPSIAAHLARAKDIQTALNK
jgi:putative membrane protein